MNHDYTSNLTFLLQCAIQFSKDAYYDDDDDDDDNDNDRCLASPPSIARPLLLDRDQLIFQVRST
jgi:hypothetical protein